RLQLTFAPIVAWLPSISPDGTKVVYGTNERAVFVSSMDGGPPQKITQDAIDASWSPDGSRLAITWWIPGKTGGDQTALELRIFDLQTGKTTPVPGSQGRIGAFWIDQHTLIAATQAGSAFLTVDLTTGKWTELTSGNFVNWILSSDSKYLYFTTGGADPSAQRLRLS